MEPGLMRSMLVDANRHNAPSV